MTGTNVAQEITTWLKHSVPRQNTEVAFYGGSFTGLAQNRQEELLGAVQPFIARGEVQSIRLSTRPDYIDTETPDFLKHYHVDTVEIGVQSLDQIVLDTNLRGHTVEASETAIGILKQALIKVGAQLLLGLPGDSTAKAITTTKRLIEIGPDFARIYPALVLRGSALEGLYRKGAYQPLSLLKAIAMSGRIKTLLEEAGIPVIRTGLQPSQELAANVIAGPYHPALGEIVLSRLFFTTIRKKLSAVDKQKIREIHASSRDHSIVVGQKRSSINRLKALGLLDEVDILFSDALPRGTLTFT